MRQRRFSRRLVLLFAAGFLALVLAPAAPAGAETILKVATMSGGPGTPVPDLLVRFAKGVEQRTGGQIKIRIYWANSLVHAKEVLEAVQIGTTDIGHLAVSYFSDKLRLITVATLPFSVNDPVKMRNNMLRVIDKVSRGPQGMGTLRPCGGVGVLDRQLPVAQSDAHPKPCGFAGQEGRGFRPHRAEGRARCGSRPGEHYRR